LPTPQRSRCEAEIIDSFFEFVKSFSKLLKNKSFHLECDAFLILFDYNPY